MDKIERYPENSYCAPDPLDLGFDEVARKKIRTLLDRNPPKNSLGVEENEYLTFLLYRAILY